MGLFERYLSVWVGLAIVVGVLFGALFPEMSALIAQLEFARINLQGSQLVHVYLNTDQASWSSFAS